MTLPAPIRVLIADDHRDYRDVLSAVIAREHGLELAAIAADAAQAIELAAREQPDVALLDMRMPAGGALAAARGIAACSPHTRMISLSASALAGELFESGVVEHVVKGSSIAVIVGSVKRAAEGLGGPSQTSTRHDPERVGRDRRPAAVTTDESPADDLLLADRAPTHPPVDQASGDGELRASRARVLQSSHAERQRIERTLHDDTQQRLVALRIRLGMTADRLDGSEERQMLERLGVEVDEIINEVRAVAFAVYPRILASRGIRAALAAAARALAVAVDITDTGFGRHSETVENVVYFCCLECLRLAAKKAGPAAAATITLTHRGGRICFRVELHGIACERYAMTPADGLINLADPIAAIGGALRVKASPGRGISITGQLPA